MERLPTALVLDEDLSFEAWLDEGRRLGREESSIQWQTGDWWLFGSRRYDRERVKLVKSPGWTGPSYGTCQNRARVCRRFSDLSRRREKLSFKHHEEVAGLSQYAADELLDRAEAEGWSASQLRREVAQVRWREADEDSTSKKVITQEGDLWLLGSHRLVCGDSRKRDVVQLALGDLRPQLMVTDPPYGVNHDPRKQRLTKGARRPVANDDRSDWREALQHFSGDVMYVWHAGVHSGIVAEAIASCGFEIRAQVIWAKEMFVVNPGSFWWQHEPAYYAVRKGGTDHWTGAGESRTVWEVSREHRSADHSDVSTPKPVELMAKAIMNHEPEVVVFDPFLGSGSTLIACEELDRVCVGIELEAAVCDSIIKRWQGAGFGVARRFNSEGEEQPGISVRRRLRV